MLMEQVFDTRLGPPWIDEEAGQHGVEINASEIDVQRAERRVMGLEVMASAWRRGRLEQRRHGGNRIGPESVHRIDPFGFDL